MDSRRLILFLVFSFSFMMLWNSWVAEQQPEVSKQGQQVAMSDQGHPDHSAVPAPSTTLSSATNPAPAVSAANTAPKMTVRTDTIMAEISAQGGDIVRLELIKHKAERGGEKGFLLFDNGTAHTYFAQSGLLQEGLPTHQTQFTLPAENAILQPGEDKLQIRLVAQNVKGAEVVKVLTFTRGSYLIDIAYDVKNTGDKQIAPLAYFQFLRDGQPAESVKAVGVTTFTGPAVYTSEENFQKISFEDVASNDAKFVRHAKDGWLAMVQHYFVSAWLPENSIDREYFAKKVGADLYSSGVILQVPAVDPGQEKSLSVKMYAGPQEQDKLKKIAPGLDLVVDYGWLTMIASPLFWVISQLHKLTGNWGWAIILVTVLIKAVFFPLSAASYKSMAKMRLLAPRMQKLKELYGDDKARMQQEIMGLYRKEKINPLGGCLPILVQLPVFLALYWTLLGSVEMRHAPWLGWIQDLSSKDPYFILPVIMGASMLIQMKLNPSPPDPIQAKVMMVMPIVFTFMFLWFPSGLVLYWVVNNLLSIAQQWQITRMIEGAKKPK